MQQQGFAYEIVYVIWRAYYMRNVVNKNEGFDILLKLNSSQPIIAYSHWSMKKHGQKIQNHVSLLIVFVLWYWQTSAIHIKRINVLCVSTELQLVMMGNEDKVYWTVWLSMSFVVML